MDAEDVVPLLDRHLTRPGIRMVEIGCGTSVVLERYLASLRPALASTFYVFKADYSAVCIEKMHALQSVCQQLDSTASSSGKSTSTQRAARKQRPLDSCRDTFVQSLDKLGVLDDSSFVSRVVGTQYWLGDASAMKGIHADATIDFVLDKGCMDALLSTGEDETGENEAVIRLFTEMHRILVPGGLLCVISRNAPFLVLPYFCTEFGDCEWDVTDSEHQGSAIGGQTSASASGCVYVYEARKVISSGP
jgi:SAM-dependent methyltransferase